MTNIEKAGLKVNTRYVKTIAILGVIFTINLTAQAQDSTAKVASGDSSQAAASGQQVERVEVIGSRIKRIAKEGASAVKNVGKESMKNSANVSASDSLRDSTIATYGATREQSGSSAAATATIGLRGLGDTRTLVLLNGHRLPKDPDAEAVDLNLIPQSAIERIEVLKDGASALYGSDALGGVINIVTKKGYVGTEASAKVSAVEKPGGTSYDISMLTGLNGEKYDFMAVMGYTHTDKIFGRDRDITKAGLSSTSTVPAYFAGGAGGDGKWHILGTCPPEYIKTTSTGQRCYYPYNEVATTRPQIGQLNLLTDYTYRLDSGIKIYNRNLVVHKDIEWNYAPTPVVTSLAAGLPGIPEASQLSYRLGDAGNRDSHDTEFNYSTLLGVKGSITSIWEYDISAGYSEIHRKNRGVNGYIDAAAFDALVNSGTYTPGVSPLGNVVTPVWQDSKSKLTTFDAVFTGELGELEDGAIGIATGISAFNEKLEQDADSKSANGEVYGSSGSISNDARDVQSGFAEVAFPLTKELELDAAARLDHYSDFGTTVNPKLSLKYTINPSVMVRTSLGTGFKAPTLSQLYGASSDGFIEFIDRKMCATDASYCSKSQYHVTGGGNKDLKEEKAFAASIGTVVQATSNISFSVDAWYTKVNNIVGINFEDMTQAELAGVNPSDYGVTVTRLPNGEIDVVNAPNLNLSNEEIIGIDFNMEVGLMNNLFGHQLVLEDDFSYIVSDKLQGFPGVEARDVSGEWGFPKWRNSTTLSMKNDVATYSITMRNIPGQKLQDRFVDAKISDLTEYDLSAGYKLTPKSNVTAGIKNILDGKQPADSFGGTGGVAAVNTDLYDYNGRKFFLGYTQKF